RCRFTEGSILLPAGYQEQTVNILIAPDAPALNIARDKLVEGEDLPSYLTRQKDLLKNGLRNWQLLEEKPATLGDNRLQGMALLSRYRPKKGQQIYQYQAVFLLNEKKALIFTLSSQQVFTDAQRQGLDDCLKSFQF
ncbi:DcrB-related protein, partial [Photorhabdus antumapuensis]|uniref:DcrB-related protein n=1 Tax=Photorhabdus antumapuensis TaxID=2862867 RepID=UPI001CEC5FE1